MDLRTAERLLNEIGAAAHGEEGLAPLQQDLLRAAVRYARARTDWAVADREGRQGLDAPRRIMHDAFIDACNILSRNVAARGRDVSWRERLGDDRREIGDFACYVHLILGIRAR